MQRGTSREEIANTNLVDIKNIIKQVVQQTVKDLVDININIENNVGDDDFPPGHSIAEGEFKDLPDKSGFTTKKLK